MPERTINRLLGSFLLGVVPALLVGFAATARHRSGLVFAVAYGLSLALFGLVAFLLLGRLAEQKKVQEPENAKEILVDWLKAHGYDGLHCEDQCGCNLQDLGCCEGSFLDCEPGHLMPCDCGGGCSYHIGPKCADILAPRQDAQTPNPAQE